MRYLLDNGYYICDDRNNVKSVTNDMGARFVVKCDARMTDDEIVKTMAEVIPFIAPSPRIA